MAPIAVPVVFFLPSIVTSHLLAVGDGLHYDLPLYTLAAQAWNAGRVPTWNPYVFSGAPLLAIGQAGVFYPPNALFLVSKFWAYNALVVGHFALAGAGTAVLARRLCADRVGAAVAGIGFALCGFFFAHVIHGNLEASAAWLPWTLLAFERLRDRFSPWRLGQAGGALALGVLTGHYQIFGITLAMLVLYAIALAVLQGRRGGGRTVLCAGAVAVVGLCLAAIQLLPTLSVLGETARPSADFAFVTAGSVPFSHLPLQLFPYLFGNSSPHPPFTAPYAGENELHELTGYPGVALLVLAVAGAGLARVDRRALALIVVAGLAFVVMLGDSTPAAHLIADIPIYGEFRTWGRYVMVVDLVVALFAGYGVAALRSHTTGIRRAAARRGLIAAGLVVAAAIAIPQLPGVARLVAPGTPGVLAVTIPTVAALLAAACCQLARRHPGLAAAAAMALVIVDPIVSFGGFFQWREAGTVASAKRLYSTPHPSQLGSLDARTPDLDRYLVQGEFEGWSLLVNATQRLRSVNGKEQLRPHAYSSALSVSPSGRVKSRSSLFDPRAHAADLLRVSVLVRHPKGQPPMVRSRHPRLPDAFIAGRVEPRSRAGVLAAVDGRGRFDPARVTLVERCGRWCRPLRGPGRAGAVVRQRRQLDSMSLHALAWRPGVLNLSEAWFPGWKAKIDGRPAPVVRANGLVIGVPVPAGRHFVSLRYQAPGLRAGALVSLFTAVALVGWGLISAAARPRQAGDRRDEAPHRSPSKRPG